VKKRLKKLALNRETILSLQGSALRGVAGGSLACTSQACPAPGTCDPQSNPCDTDGWTCRCTEIC
jgi:hypothetical protein